MEEGAAFFAGVVEVSPASGRELCEVLSVCMVTAASIVTFSSVFVVFLGIVLFSFSFDL